MKKLKIKGLASENYPGGRIDSFTIPLMDNPHSQLIPLFIELGMPEKDALDELDTDFKHTCSAGTSFFVYVSPNLKAHLIIEEQTLNIEFDTSLPKEKIISIMKKFFIFPDEGR